MFAVYAKIQGRVTREPIGLVPSYEAGKSAANAWLKKTAKAFKVEGEHIPIAESDWVEEAYDDPAEGEVETLAYAHAVCDRGPLKCRIVIQEVSASV